MQISESVIRLDLPNSSDHTKADPITAKKINRLRFVPTFVVANKFCLNKRHYCFFRGVVGVGEFTLMQLRHHRILRHKIVPVCCSLYVGLWLLNVVL